MRACVRVCVRACVRGVEGGGLGVRSMSPQVREEGLSIIMSYEFQEENV